VAQRRGRPDLGQESFGAEHGAELGVQDLHGDEPVVLRVAREVDDRHAATADRGLHHVPPGEGGRELGGDPHECGSLGRTRHDRRGENTEATSVGVATNCAQSGRGRAKR